MNDLNGYLEYNGLIYKIQSIEQLRDFMNGLGEKSKEMTEQEISCRRIFLSVRGRNISSRHLNTTEDI